ncbi:MAG TPA: hypothetical protein VKE22_19260 [Haliangiales bacterium]|nr:hypothetical protein [Haliangiales bacterium]
MRFRWLLVTSFLGVLLGGNHALAKKKPKPTPTASANQGAVQELMGPYKWGMTLDQVLGTLEKQISSRYTEELAKLSDVYRRQQIQKDIKSEVAVVRRSATSFEGAKTGWDVSIIEGEFAHGTDESMAVYHEQDPAAKKDQRRFFFFSEGKLWKMFIAFDMTPFKDKTFVDFRDIMEARYGRGTPVMKPGPDGKPKLASVEWRAGGSTLRAVDLLKFYGNFCLVLSDDSVEKVVLDKRAVKAPKPPPRAAVTEGPTNAQLNDPNANIVDEITKDAAKPGTTDTPKPAPAEPKK